MPGDVVENASFEGLLNTVRGNFGAGDVEYNAQLGLAAQTHATDMLTQDYLSHDGLNGSTLVNRVEDTGYNWQTIGENIAQGQTSQVEVLEDWENSTEHHANNINPNFEDFGLGVAGSGSDTRWVLVLGAEF